MIPLGRDDHMLVPIQAEVDERRVEVQRVSNHDVEESRVVGEHALEQPLGGGLFSLAGLEQLDIQDQGEALADQVADHPLVIVFGYRLPIDDEGARLALRATALPTGKELMAVDRRDIPAFMAGQCLVPLEPVGDIAEDLPQRLAIHQLIDTADGVDTGDCGLPRCRATARGCAGPAPSRSGCRGEWRRG